MVIEVEVRGPLSEEQYARIKKALDTKGEFKKAKDRTFIAYTSSADPTTTLDVRARITNGTGELNVKVGEWKGSHAREEISVLVQKGEFMHLLRALEALGYNTGVIGRRKSEVYEHAGIEFALVEVPGHSRYFEAEISVESTAHAPAARARIDQVCKELGLQEFSEKEFFEYIDRLDSESNEQYRFDEHAKRFSGM